MTKGQTKRSRSNIDTQLNRERTALSLRIERALETPMVLLGLVWLVLLVLDLTRGLSPLLQLLSHGIWILFLVDFLFRFAIAPQKVPFLRRSILTMVSLALPALRVFRVIRALRLLRFARATRSLHLVRIVTSLNRGMRALAGSMSRRGLGYVLGTTGIVLVTGAAGILTFERDVSHAAAPQDYGEALWWTAMLLTTMGSEYWPKSPEGRILCFMLSLYAFAMFGYVTAALATFFVGRDAHDQRGEIAGQQAISALQQEVAALRQELSVYLGNQTRETKETS